MQNRTISVALTYTRGQVSTQNLNITNSIKVTIIGLARGGGPASPSNRNATKDKTVTKKILFLHFQFLLASLRTTLITNNIDDQEAGVPSIRFCQPIEIYRVSQK